MHATRLFLLMFIALGSVVTSSNIQATQATEGLLRIATISLSPAGYKENGLPKGLFYDISNAVASKAGLNYKNTIKPYGRVLNDLKAGKADMSMLGVNPALEEKTIKVIPIIELNFILVGQKGLDIRSLDNFAGKVVGIIRGAQPIAASYVDGATIITVTDFAQGIKMLKAKRLDALAISELGFYFALVKMDLSRDDFGPSMALSKSAAYMYFSSHFVDQDKIARLKVALQSLIDDGGIQQIMRQYVGEDYFDKTPMQEYIPYD